MASSENWKPRFSSMNKKLKIPYNPYLAHRALSKLEFPIGNIYCIIPKERTPQPLQLSIIAISISYEVGQEQKAMFFVVILKQLDTKDLSNHQEFFFFKSRKEKNSHVFLLKKVGGVLIRVGVLNRDYTIVFDFFLTKQSVLMLFPLCLL